MAKRREQKDEAESKEFEIPKFDKEKFIIKEKEKIKATFIAFIFAFVIALISFGFWILLQDSPFQWTLVVLFGIFSASWIQYLFRQFSIDMDKIERKGLFSSFAIYLFTWLFILIVLVNPPIYDAEAPTIEMQVLPEMQEPGGDIVIVSKVIDNSGLNKEDITLLITHNGNTSEITDFSYNTEDILEYNFTNPTNLYGDFDVRIEATDNSGLTKSVVKSFSYSNDTILLPEPQGITTYPGPPVSYATTIKFDVEPQIDRLYYVINNETVVNVTEKEGRFYVSYPEYKGWKPGSVMSIKVYAEVYFYFDIYSSGSSIEASKIRPYKNTIIDNQVYYFNVSDDSNIGEKELESVTLPKPKVYDVPGFELLLFLVSIVGVLFIIKYKKSNKKNKP